MNRLENHAPYTNNWREDSPSASEKKTGATIQKSLSHKLTDAANVLREKSDALSEKNRDLANYGNVAAEWLERSANYLEELNPQQLKSDLKGQVRNHPGRSLLIATAAGLFIGTLIRRR